MPPSESGCEQNRPSSHLSDENDPGALRVELSVQAISARGVAIIAIDDPKFGDERERERPVRIVLSLTQAADLARRLQAVLSEI